MRLQPATRKPRLASAAAAAAPSTPNPITPTATALAGATLDVFAREPLPVTSPLWRHPKVTITPHNAAFSDPQALAAGVLRQIERFEAGLPLEHVIDRARGY